MKLAAIVVGLALVGIAWAYLGRPGPEVLGQESAEKSVPPGERADPAGRIALLVGVGRYPEASGLERLEGAAGDALRMKAVLVERFGFRDEDCLVLLEEQATHEGIVRAFRDFLIERAGPETHAVFFFSGHGSQVPDRSGVRQAELDRKDSTYVCYDSRGDAPPGSRDLTDDELRSLLEKLVEKTPHVVVITDSCHSGGGVRGDEVAFKFAPRGPAPLDLDWMRGFWPADVSYTDDSERPLPAERYLHIAACRNSERAAEVMVPGKGRQGLLTRHLIQRLEKARVSDSWRLIIEDTRVRVATELASQTVDSSGKADRALFGGEFQEVEGYPARVGATAMYVEVDAGHLHGLRIGSELEIRDLRGRTVRGLITLEEVSQTFSVGRWQEPRVARLAGGLRAIELTRTANMPPLRVRVLDPKLARDLAGSERIAIAASGETANYELFRDAAGRLCFRTMEGVLIFREENPGEASVGMLEMQAFRKELRWLSSLGLAIERGAYPLEVRVRPASPEELASLGKKAPLEPLTFVEAGFPFAEESTSRPVIGGFEGEGPMQVGVLEIENPHTVDLFVSVLTVAEDRGCTPLTFQGGEHNVPIPRGDDRQAFFGALARHDWPLERPMRDRYLVIATTQPADYSSLGQEAVMRGEEERPLPSLLQLALDEADATRGESPGRVVVEKPWGVSSVDLLVAKP
jgi:hypothetical protein